MNEICFFSIKTKTEWNESLAMLFSVFVVLFLFFFGNDCHLIENGCYCCDCGWCCFCSNFVRSIFGQYRVRSFCFFFVFIYCHRWFGFMVEIFFCLLHNTRIHTNCYARINEVIWSPSVIFLFFSRFIFVAALFFSSTDMQTKSSNLKRNARRLTQKYTFFFCSVVYCIWCSNLNVHTVSLWTNNNKKNMEFCIFICLETAFSSTWHLKLFCAKSFRFFRVFCISSVRNVAQVSFQSNCIRQTRIFVAVV